MQHAKLCQDNTCNSYTQAHVIRPCIPKVYIYIYIYIYRTQRLAKHSTYKHAKEYQHKMFFHVSITNSVDLNHA